jgi:peptidoglycan/LPS O-acetylase OafA/YrhL
MSAWSSWSRPPKAREVAFDILKGIGICEVLTHHAFSFSARKFTERNSLEWWSLMMANRLLHFAIPAFLLVSAILLSRSLSKHEKPDFRRYLSRRVARTLWPYLVWTLLFLLYRAFFMGIGSDVHPYTASFFGLQVTGPNVLLDPAELKYYFVWGKAYFHLYFLSVLLQLSLVLPVLLWIVRRVRLNFVGVAALAAALQLGAYLAQANIWRSPHPASTLAWYVPPVLIGVWLGVNWSRWQLIWRRYRRWIAAFAFVGGVPYLVLSAYALQDIHVSNLAMNSSLAVFATSVALWLLGYATQADAQKRLVPALAYLGTLSLPIFVVHPVLLYLMGGPTISSVLDAIPGTPFIVLGLTLGLSLAVTHMLIWMRLDLPLFGRRFEAEMRAAQERRSQAVGAAQ